MNWIIWSLFFIAFVYSILDAWHTKLLLATGLIQEANPLMNYFIVTFGIDSCFYIKIIMFVVLGELIKIYEIKYYKKLDKQINE